MATMNSSVLACSYVISGAASSELNAKLTLVASPTASSYKLSSIKAQQPLKIAQASEGRRAALVSLAATVFAATAAVVSDSAANAGVIEEYLERSKANKRKASFSPAVVLICSSPSSSSTARRRPGIAVGVVRRCSWPSSWCCGRRLQLLQLSEEAGSQTGGGGPSLADTEEEVEAAEDELWEGRIVDEEWRLVFSCC